MDDQRWDKKVGGLDPGPLQEVTPLFPRKLVRRALRGRKNLPILAVYQHFQIDLFHNENSNFY